MPLWFRVNISPLSIFVLFSNWKYRTTSKASIKKIKTNDDERVIKSFHFRFYSMHARMSSFYTAKLISISANWNLLDSISCALLCVCFFLHGWNEQMVCCIECVGCTVKCTYSTPSIHYIQNEFEYNHLYIYWKKITNNNNNSNAFWIWCSTE